MAGEGWFGDSALGLADRHELRLGRAAVEQFLRMLAAPLPLDQVEHRPGNVQRALAKILLRIGLPAQNRQNVARLERRADTAPDRGGAVAAMDGERQAEGPRHVQQAAAERLCGRIVAYLGRGPRRLR